LNKVLSLDKEALERMNLTGRRFVESEFNLDRLGRETDAVYSSLVQ
jgi:hypothetical protein